MILSVPGLETVRFDVSGITKTPHSQLLHPSFSVENCQDFLQSRGLLRFHLHWWFTDNIFQAISSNNLFDPTTTPSLFDLPPTFAQEYHRCLSRSFELLLRGPARWRFQCATAKIHCAQMCLFCFFCFDGFIVNKSKDSKAWQFLSCTCGQGYGGPPTQPFANMIRVGSPEKTCSFTSNLHDPQLEEVDTGRPCGIDGYNYLRLGSLSITFSWWWWWWLYLVSYSDLDMSHFNHNSS